MHPLFEKQNNGSYFAYAQTIILCLEGDAL